jgi:replication factor C subunit 3/5
MKKNDFFLQVLNILQSCSMAFDVVDENNVYTCVGHPLRSDISNMVDWMLNDSFTEAYSKVQKLKILKGLSLQVSFIRRHKRFANVKNLFAILITMRKRLPH